MVGLYLVLEIQDNGEHIGTLSYEYHTYEDAEAKYHTILAVAAKSDILYHGAALFQNARMLSGEGFTHLPEPQE